MLEHKRGRSWWCMRHAHGMGGKKGIPGGSLSTHVQPKVARLFKVKGKSKTGCPSNHNIRCIAKDRTFFPLPFSKGWVRWRENPLKLREREGLCKARTKKGKKINCSTWSVMVIVMVWILGTFLVANVCEGWGVKGWWEVWWGEESCERMQEKEEKIGWQEKLCNARNERWGKKSRSVTLTIFTITIKD